MPSAFRRSGTTSKKKVSEPGLSTPANPSAWALSSGSSSAINNKTSTKLPLRLPRGVKPWQGGTYLTSVGVNDLDSILGGGQLMGSSILLEEDRLCTRELALTLVKYWCAEAVSHDHDLVIPVFSTSSHSNSSRPKNGDDDDSLSSMFRDDWSESEEQPWRNLRDELHDLLLGLPRNLHWDKQKKKEEKAKREQEAAASDISSGLGSMNLGPMAILEEDEEEETKKADDELEVAWQYKKSVQQERLAQSKSNTESTSVSTDVFCHSYDLSGRMHDQKPLDPSACIHELTSKKKRSGTEYNLSYGYNLFYGLVQLLKERSSLNNDKAIRLLLFHPPLEALSAALPLLLAYIRKNEMPVVLMIVHAPTADVKSKIRLGRSCDVVLSTEGFASRREYPPPAEFRHLLGVLKTAKTTRKRSEVAASIYGFKRDRRKLHIPLLHIPPEDYAEGGGSVGGGGVRSGAGRRSSSNSEADGATARKPSSGGMGCSSNMSGSLLDF
mmetsp:Transcript_23285/g.55058  ORF Transcript_23285/g.55058 Transcript_23285/m.55058 type:complete len:497 (+) Transcript_23285:211-1701(+)